MKTKLLVLLLAGSSLFAAPRVAVGFGWGAPRPAVVYAVPPAPGPGYTRVAGYRYEVGPRYAWRGGYWARRPYPGAYWVGPRWYGRHYYRGYWRR